MKAVQSTLGSLHVTNQSARGVYGFNAAPQDGASWLNPNTPMPVSGRAYRVVARC
jgi:hypothetical protein